jgi:hypothetical protein
MVPYPVVGFHLPPNLLDNPGGFVSRNDRIVELPIPGVKPLFQRTYPAIGCPYQYIPRPDGGPGNLLDNHTPRFMQKGRLHIKSSC